MSGSTPLPVALSRTLDVVRLVAQGATQVLLTGFVIVLPFVILGFLVGLALDFTRQVLQPLTVLLEWTGLVRMANFGVVGNILLELGFYDDVYGVIGEFLAILTLLGVIIALGLFASFRSGERAMAYVDHGVSAIPGLGPVYESFRRVGNIILEDGLEEFQSVKLVEFPNQGCYSLAFETNEAPESIQSITGEGETVSVFVPLAPNPVMGGFLIHISRERVFDVDMTVEEAGRAIITSGFAAGEDGLGSNQSTPRFNR